MRSILAMAAVAVLISAPAWADSSGIKIDQVWARATPGAAKTAAIYLTVTNTGTTPDTLEGAASTPAAEHADLHEEKMANGVMEMRPVKSLTIAPGKSVTLEPNGYHIMLTGLKAPLKEGQSVKLTLTFEHAGTQQVTASVAKVGAMHAGETSGGSAGAGMSYDMSSMPGMSH
ncbi:MAG TPA: copper chaperone PCu(A)C [Stellaceae bacterium]|nr:copper chaperone PCu(A)C [Stellaceae bacterium]